jgi:hypothetical protein
MAVARVLDPQPQQVNVNSNFDAHPAGVQITDSQPVKFNNNSGSTISITFAPTAITNRRVFNDITSLVSGQSVSESPLVTGVTVNYEVWYGLQNYGPFAIEVGTGPLEISVTNGLPTPNRSAVPPNGEIQFSATDKACTVNWSPNNPTNPAITTVQVGPANNPPSTVRGSLGQAFSYSLNTDAAAHKVHKVQGGGGGTIKVT